MSVPTPTKKDEKKVGGGPASGVPNVPCPHCPKKFMRGYNMRVHIERVHNKSKPWQCQFCEKTFATTSDLKQHLSSHGMGKIHKVIYQSLANLGYNDVHKCECFGVFLV